MFSVEPILARTFLRSGAEALVAGRLGLGAEELGLADVGFLSKAEVPEGREGMGVGLTRLGAMPAGGVAPGTVAFFFTALLEVLFERLKSAEKVGETTSVQETRDKKERSLRPRKRWGIS